MTEHDANWEARVARLEAERDAAHAAREKAEAALTAALAKIAATLELTLTGRCDPTYAIVLDIGRLLDVQKRWVNACELARIHCPVEDGESHIRQGIPRLADRAEKAEADTRRLDWLERHDCWIGLGGACGVDAAVGVGIRGVIDAALASEPKEGRCAMTEFKMPPLDRSPGLMPSPKTEEPEYPTTITTMVVQIAALRGCVEKLEAERNAAIASVDQLQNELMAVREARRLSDLALADALGRAEKAEAERDEREFEAVQVIGRELSAAWKTLAKRDAERDRAREALRRSCLWPACETTCSALQHGPCSILAALADEPEAP